MSGESRGVFHVGQGSITLGGGVLDSAIQPYLPGALVAPQAGTLGVTLGLQEIS